MPFTQETNTYIAYPIYQLGTNECNNYTHKYVIKIQMQLRLAVLSLPVLPEGFGD